MKLLVDYDDQYLIRRVENPLWVWPKVWKGAGEYEPSPEAPKKMSPQMMKLIRLLEEKFLDRWCYVKEYREVLREIDFGEKNTLQQVTWRFGEAERARIARMFYAAQEEFMATAGSNNYHEDNVNRISYAPCPLYKMGGASDTGPSAYALFRRRRSVLIRSGVLVARRSVRKRIGELLGRPLLPEECILQGPKKKLLQIQVETMLAQGFLGGVVTELNFLGDPRLALAVRGDPKQFRELIKKYNNSRGGYMVRRHQEVTIVTDHPPFRDNVLPEPGAEVEE